MAWVLLAIVVYIAAQEIALARAAREEVAHRWAFVWSVLGSVFLVGRILERETEGLASVVGGRLEAAVGASMIPIGVLVARSLVRRPLAGRWFWGLLGTAATLLAAITCTDVLIPAGTPIRFDAAGHRFHPCAPVPLLPGLVVLGVASGVHSLRLFRRYRERLARPSRVVVPLTVLFAAAGINDALVVSGALRGVLLFEYGFLALAIGSNYFLVLRVTGAREALEAAVAARTRELEEQQKRNAAAERLASLGTLAAGTAHEINNPLTYVTGNLELLGMSLRESPDGERHELAKLVDEALEGCVRIRDVVRDMRALTRDDAGEHTADLRRVLDLALQMTAHEVRHRATVVKVLEPVPLVVGDRGRLVQVFVNLLVNAAHAIPPGHADEYEIVVSTRVRDGMVEAEVADSGTGIPRESVDRIFEPFYTTKPVGEGTGLGLAICHGIVTSYGGEILVSSTPGRGSVFTVRLQRAERDSCDAPPSRPSLGGLPPGVRVLVVDDDPGVRQLLGRLLGEQRLVFAASGREALERCRVERFDLLVCDLMMAELTGKELYEALEREDPESARRTVFVSGGASTEDLSRFAALHASRVVAKPFEASTLTDVLSAVLAERGPRPEGGSSKPPSKVA